MSLDITFEFRIMGWEELIINEEDREEACIFFVRKNTWRTPYQTIKEALEFFEKCGRDFMMTDDWDFEDSVSISFWVSEHQKYVGGQFGRVNDSGKFCWVVDMEAHYAKVKLANEASALKREKCL